MNLAALVEPTCAIVGAKIANKAQLLDLLAKTAAAHCPVSYEAIRERLAAREELGSTGLGHGFALPHARVEGLEKMTGILLKLPRPIEFESIDDKPVDLVFCLLVPPRASNEQVAAMSLVSRRMREEARVAALRRAKTGEALLKALTEPQSGPTGN